MESNQNNNLDELLSDLKSKYKASKPSNNPEIAHNKANDTDNLLNEVKSEIKTNKSSVPANTKKITPNNSQADEYLDSIKAQYKNKQTHKKSQEELTFNRNKEEIIIQEQQKQLKRKQLIRQAEKWLANLDPSSDEGLWFNQLAESYPSKLEAAIHYLSLNIDN